MLSQAANVAQQRTLRTGNASRNQEDIVMGSYVAFGKAARKRGKAGETTFRTSDGCTMKLQGEPESTAREDIVSWADGQIGEVKVTLAKETIEDTGDSYKPTRIMDSEALADSFAERYGLEEEREAEREAEKKREAKRREAEKSAAEKRVNGSAPAPSGNASK